MPPIIEVDRVTKEFRLGQLTSLTQSVRNGINRVLGRPVAERAPFKALDEVSFSVEPGEVLGIIGHNGAGKSTLLKILAGISQPTQGRVDVRGRVAPLIEVGAGLVPDMTGRENVFLNASILGMKRAEIKRKFDEIVAFAELEEFIDTPIKRYSSGMQVRLGFAIATAVQSEILIVDEVLAVGDLAFQRKCFDRMERLIRREGRTVFVVSHNIRQIERLCSRVVLLERGRVIRAGIPVDVCNLFYERSDDSIQRHRAGDIERIGRRETSADIEMISIQVLDSSHQQTETLRCLGPGVFEIIFRVHATVKKPIFGFGFHTSDFVYLATIQSIGSLNLEALEPGEYKLRFNLRRMPFLPGVYSVRLGVALGDSFQPIYYLENATHVRVVDPTVNRAIISANGEGFVRLEGDWAIDNVSAPRDRVDAIRRPSSVL